MGATMDLSSTLKNSANQASAFQEKETYTVREAFNLWDDNPERREIARNRYVQNYQTIYHQLPQKWKEHFHLMAQSPVGQKIIANMPDNVDIDMLSAFSLGENTGAAYDHLSNELELPKRLENLKKLGLTPYGALIHECRHAMQDYLGLAVIDENVSLSAKDVAYLNVLIEADAHAVHKTEEQIIRVFGTPNPSKQQIQNFMKKDFLPDQKKEGHPDYLFQKMLKNQNGNLNKARRSLMQQNFKKEVQGELSINHYHMQALEHVILQAKKGKLSAQDNTQLTSQIYQKMAKMYGLPADYFEKSIKMPPAFHQCIAYAKKYPDLTDKQLTTAFQKIYDNTEQNGSHNAYLQALDINKQQNR